VSGAVDCPVCHTTASLSREDITLVEQAARVQMRDGTYNRRFEPLRSNHKRGLALLPETRAEYAKRAGRLRPEAVHTCPYCLYDLSGVLDDESTKPCPECGEEVSLAGNTLVWGERGSKARIGRAVTLYAGLVIGSLSWMALIGGTTKIFSGPATLLWVIAIIGMFGLPIGVPIAAFEWLKRRNPTVNEGLLWVTSVLAGLANLVVALLLMVIASALLPVL